MGKEPDEIRAEIAQTRAELGRDVDTLADKVTPTKMVERRVHKMRSSFSTAKDKVMGIADDYRSTAAGSVQSATSAVGSAAETVGETVTRAPDYAKRSTQGNPLAAGVIAFGCGWLASTLLPTTRVEQQAGERAKEQVADLAEPVKQRAAQAAQEVKDNLQPQAQRAMESVKQTAAEAAGEMKSTAQDQGTHVHQQAAESVGTVVTDEARGSGPDRQP